MSAVVLALPAAPVQQPHRRAYLLSESGVIVEFRWTPPETTKAGLAPAFAIIDRPGLRPLARRASSSLETYSFTPTIGEDPEVSCEAELSTLQALADSAERVQLVYGQLEQGWWQITSLEISVRERVEGTNDVSRADLPMTLTAASDLRITPGKAPTTPAAASEAKWTTHTVTAGDTLFRLATRYLGDGTRWPEIASANGIKNPLTDTALNVGSVLKIPPR